MHIDDIATDEYEVDNDYPTMFLSYRAAVEQYRAIPSPEAMLKFIVFNFPADEHRKLLLNTWLMYERVAYYFKDVCEDHDLGHTYYTNQMTNAATVYGAWTLLHEIASHNNCSKP